MPNVNNPTPSWMRLDNAAKIYPAVRRRNWSNLFRQSVTLTEPVDIPVLKASLEVTVKRFPSIAARLRKGVFWYYLQPVEQPPEIREDYSYPLSFMSKGEMRRCAFRVLVYRNRIALEFFHSLTDGAGALVFLKSLTAEYLEQKYHISIPAECGVLDRRQSPGDWEIEDCFPKYAGAVPANRRATDAWHMAGQPQTDGFLNLVCFRIPVEKAREMARRYGCTLTVLFAAAVMLALLELQKQKQPIAARRKHIKVLIPVNLRQLFPSRTLRNFALYTTPEVDPRLGEYTMEELCRIVSCRLGLEVTAKHMSSVIATNVNDERNPLVRLIPLPVKNAVMKAVYDSVGEKKSCLSLSNLGQVQVPREMEAYIQRFDFILGVQATAPYNCGMLSYGDTLYLNVIRNICQPELEQQLFRVFRKLGLPVMVESNGRME